MFRLRLTLATAAVAIMVSAPVAGQQESTLVADLLRDVADVQQKMVGLAEAMPESSYDWRPSEGVRSVGEVFKHLASDNWLLPAAVGHPAPAATGIEGDDYRTAVAYEKRTMSKAEIVQALSASFEHVIESMKTTSSARLAETEKVFGGDMTVQALWLLEVTHIHEHLGQSIAYARANGVTPPLEPMMADRLRVAVIGAGRWSRTSHLPGFHRSPLCDLVAICDLDRELAEARAAEFSIPDVETDAAKLLARDDIDVVDIVTRSDHQDLVFTTLDAGKHCLVEKPVCHDYRDVWRAHDLALSKGLKTKVGLTFRYAPAVMYMFDLIRQGFIGTPFIFNGYEQNSQWLDPDNPMDKRIHKVKPEGEKEWGTDLTREGITVSSLEGYGAPTIDIGLECVGSDLTQVVGMLANMVKNRRRTNLDSERERINIDDADMFMAEAANGAMFSLQSSYVTVGNYPGIEARIYGSAGAIQVRLVEEFGVIQSIKTATPDAVEFVEREIPEKYFPPGYRADDAWGTAFFGNLVHNFLEEIVDGGDTNQGNFAQSARVQEIINAAALSHRERRWISLPLEGDVEIQSSPW